MPMRRSATEDCMLMPSSVSLVSRPDDTSGQVQALRAAEEEFKAFKIRKAETYETLEKDHRILTDNNFLTELKLLNANEVRHKMERMYREKQDEIEAYMGMSEEDIHAMFTASQDRVRDEKTGDPLKIFCADIIEKGKRYGEKSREVMDSISYSKVEFVPAINIDEQRPKSLTTSLTPTSSEAKVTNLGTFQQSASSPQINPSTPLTPSSPLHASIAPQQPIPQPPSSPKKGRFSSFFSQISPKHNRTARNLIIPPRSPKKN